MLTAVTIAVYTSTHRDAIMSSPARTRLKSGDRAFSVLPLKHETSCQHASVQALLENVLVSDCLVPEIELNWTLKCVIVLVVGL